MRRLWVLLIATSVLAGCGSDAGAATRGTLIKVSKSQFGPAIADSRGEALYLFTADGTGPSRCYGSCARAWPPLLTKGTPRAGTGIRRSWLGTKRRKDGKRQVTYRGRPLYYFVNDDPGKILCHNVFEYGGNWLIMARTGRAAPH